MKINKEKITSHFGEDFYNKLQTDLDKYSKLWELSNFTQIDYYSINAIFECESIKHGQCVLKIGGTTPDFVKETENEYNILREYTRKRFCEVFEADTANGVLLLERIKPGTRLRDESDLEKRLNIFCEISRGLHVKPSDKSLYPAYKGWVSRITEFMRRFDGGKYHELLQKMIKAEKVCFDLCEKYTDEMLLHGDLHHDNILAGNEGYRIVDPKGVIGDPVFDIPRFILNEFPEPTDEIDIETDMDFYYKYRKITKTLAEKFNIPEYNINRLIYVETCMANCWNVESGLEPDMKQVKFTEVKMKAFDNTDLSELDELDKTFDSENIPYGLVTVTVAEFILGELLSEASRQKLCFDEDTRQLIARYTLNAKAFWDNRISEKALYNERIDAWKNHRQAERNSVRANLLRLVVCCLYTEEADEKYRQDSVTGLYFHLIKEVDGEYCKPFRLYLEERLAKVKSNE